MNSSNAKWNDRPSRVKSTGELLDADPKQKGVPHVIVTGAILQNGEVQSCKLSRRLLGGVWVNRYTGARTQNRVLTSTASPKRTSGTENQTKRSARQVSAVP